MQHDVSDVGNSLRATYELVTEILQFRRPHTASVKDSMLYRSEVDLKGSGGDMEVLEFLLDRTHLVWEQLRDRLKTAA
jgi:hypothetical protein